MSNRGCLFLGLYAVMGVVLIVVGLGSSRPSYCRFSYVAFPICSLILDVVFVSVSPDTLALRWCLFGRSAMRTWTRAYRSLCTEHSVVDLTFALAPGS